MKKRLLLHTCCAPCVAYVHELLKDEFSLDIYFFNPNIMPKEEYDIRLNELKSFSSLRGATLIIEEPHTKDFLDQIDEFKLLGERSERCWTCYEIRLRQTFVKAKNSNYDIVGTSLTISPHKDAKKINEIGERLSKEFGVEFFVSDFKKKDGFKNTMKLAKELNFYRQNYCGCIYSKMERERKI